MGRENQECGGRQECSLSKPPGLQCHKRDRVGTQGPSVLTCAHTSRSRLQLADTLLSVSLKASLNISRSPDKEQKRALLMGSRRSPSASTPGSSLQSPPCRAALALLAHLPMSHASHPLRYIASSQFRVLSLARRLRSDAFTSSSCGRKTGTAEVHSRPRSTAAPPHRIRSLTSLASLRQSWLRRPAARPPRPRSCRNSSSRPLTSPRSDSASWRAARPARASSRERPSCASSSRFSDAKRVTLRRAGGGRARGKLSTL